MAIVKRCVVGAAIPKELHQKLFDAYKGKDKDFGAEDNAYELKVLGGCILALAMSDEKAPNLLVANAIVSACFVGSRVPSVGFDLVGVAKNVLAVGGVKARGRQALLPVKRPLFPTKKIDDALAAMDAAKDLNTWIAQIRSAYAELVGHLGVVHRSLFEQADQSQRLLAIQDEELDVLWWVFGGRSVLLEVPFESIAKAARPIALGREIAGMTVFDTPPPSIAGILGKVGQFGDDDLTVKDAVNAYIKLGAIDPNLMTPCETLTPIHFALARARETKGGEEWISGWSGATQLPKTVSLKRTEMAIQTCREVLLLRQ